MKILGGGTSGAHTHNFTTTNLTVQLVVLSRSVSFGLLYVSGSFWFRTVDGASVLSPSITCGYMSMSLYHCFERGRNLTRRVNL